MDTPRLTSLLFVPGDSPAKAAKARTSGAAGLILDLEDSVGPDRKAEARAGLPELIEATSSADGPSIWVRINPLDSGLAQDDLAAAVRAGLTGIMLPKASGGEDIARLSAMLDGLERKSAIEAGSTRILPIVTETPAALFALASYAPAHPRLAALTWGAEDLSAVLGATATRADGDWTGPYATARALTLFAAANAGVPAIDTVYTDFRDAEGLGRSARAARRDGFAGQMAIHPAQVAVIEAAYAPSEEDIALARRIVAAFAETPGLGTVGIDGQMIDIPHLKRARRLLASAGLEA
ncbi:CoA ester lyase [Silicimonas algicola]|nr:CoA ester lyase [Silicimonas algicola]AZQ67014.1 CoA ester lyase [Silicimonas algicola]